MMKEKTRLPLDDYIGKIVRKNDLENGSSWMLVTDVQKKFDENDEQLKGILIKKVSRIDTTSIGSIVYWLVSDVDLIIPIAKYYGRIQSQSEIIENELLTLIGSGMKDKSNIYDYIVDKHNFPRPTVRRTAVNLRRKYEYVFQILNEGVSDHVGGRKKKTDNETDDNDV